MRFIIAFILMLPLALLAQPVEPLIPVATIGAYGAGVGDIPTVASGATIHTHITRAALGRRLRASRERCAGAPNDDARPAPDSGAPAAVAHRDHPTGLGRDTLIAGRAFV